MKFDEDRHLKNLEDIAWISKEGQARATGEGIWMILSAPFIALKKAIGHKKDFERRWQSFLDNIDEDFEAEVKKEASRQLDEKFMQMANNKTIEETKMGPGKDDLFDTWEENRVRDLATTHAAVGRQIYMVAKYIKHNYDRLRPYLAWILSAKSAAELQRITNMIEKALEDNAGYETNNVRTWALPDDPIWKSINVHPRRKS